MKNERAFVMALAYFIGFTTAFLTFGYVSNPEFNLPTLSDSMVSDNYQASVIESAPELKESVTPTKEVTVDLEPHLIMTVDGEARYVSASYEEASNLGAQAHTALSLVTLSEDKNFLFYCASNIDSEDACVPFIYDWSKNRINFVTLNGSKLSFIPSEVEVSWTENGFLNLGDVSSVDPSTSWLLE